MTKEEFTEEYKISIYTHRWWNFDEQPPEKYKQQVKQYLIDHPEEFKARVRSDPLAPARRFNKILTLLTLFCNIFMV